jgi:hypothetical protein
MEPRRNRALEARLAALVRVLALAASSRHRLYGPTFSLFGFQKSPSVFRFLRRRISTPFFPTVNSVTTRHTAPECQQFR